jgi:hypothetical protein
LLNWLPMFTTEKLSSRTQVVTFAKLMGTQPEEPSRQRDRQNLEPVAQRFSNRQSDDVTHIDVESENNQTRFCIRFPKKMTDD